MHPAGKSEAAGAVEATSEAEDVAEVAGEEEETGVKHQEKQSRTFWHKRLH